MFFADKMYFKKTDPLAILPKMYYQNTIATLENPKTFCLEPYQSCVIDLLMTMSAIHPCKIMPPSKPTRTWFHTDEYLVPDEDGKVMLKIHNASPQPQWLLATTTLCILWESLPSRNPTAGEPSHINRFPVNTAPTNSSPTDTGNPLVSPVQFKKLPSPSSPSNFI